MDKQSTSIAVASAFGAFLLASSGVQANDSTTRLDQIETDSTVSVALNCRTSGKIFTRRSVRSDECLETLTDINLHNTNWHRNHAPHISPNDAGILANSEGRLGALKGVSALGHDADFTLEQNTLSANNFYDVVIGQGHRPSSENTYLLITNLVKCGTGNYSGCLSLNTHYKGFDQILPKDKIVPEVQITPPRENPKALGDQNLADGYFAYCANGNIFTPETASTMKCIDYTTQTQELIAYQLLIEDKIGAIHRGTLKRKCAVIFGGEAFIERSESLPADVLMKKNTECTSTLYSLKNDLAEDSVFVRGAMTVQCANQNFQSCNDLTAFALKHGAPPQIDL